VRIVRPDEEYYRVVVNGEGHHAIWPLAGPAPVGWKPVGFHGSRAGCLAYVAELTPAGPHTPLPRTPVTHHGPTLGEVWARSAASHADAVAVSHGGHRITYRELDERSDALAAALLDAGARPEDRVLMWLHPGVDMVVALLGGVKSGAAYVCVDARAGAGEWRAAAVDDCGARLAVVGSERPPGWPGRAVAAVDRLTVLDRGGYPRGDADRADERLDGAHALTVCYAPRSFSPRALFGAGTGPKAAGVVVEHRHLLVAMWNAALPPVGPGDRTVARASPSTDLVGMELWYPLLHGAQVVIDPMPATDPPGPLWTLLAHRSGGSRPRPVWLLGHAEAGSAFAVVEPGHPSRLRPLSSFRLHVLDRHLRPVTAGEVGELYVAGPALARGYLGRPDLTIDRFLPDPFDGEGWRMYAVGATAVYRAPDTIHLSSLRVTGR
jgi:non-ribosomal peptide synthetase component F